MKFRIPYLKQGVLLGLAMAMVVACQTSEKASDSPSPGVTAANEQSQAGPEAPALQVAEWLKGQPVNLADGRGKQIYVVEFWATWCPPCRASIPHMSELQKKYAGKNVTFIGISAEKNAKAVRDFVEKMGDKMDYTVALDKNGATDEAYNAPNGVNSIPHAYVIDKNGAVAWHGHPQDPQMESLLQSLTS